MQTSRIEQLRKLIELEPEEIFYPYALALELYTNNKAEAFGLLENVIRKNADYLPAYYQIGKLAIELQKVDLAIQFLQRGIEVALHQKDLKTKSELTYLLEALTED